METSLILPILITLIMMIGTMYYLVKGLLETLVNPGYLSMTRIILHIGALIIIGGALTVLIYAILTGQLNHRI